MKTSVRLQEAFEYMKWPVIVGAILIVAMLFILIGYQVYCRRKKQTGSQKTAPERIAPKRSIGALRGIYLARIEKLEKDLQEGKTESRDCFQQLSAIVRSFVWEVTEKDVTTCTLEEIRQMNLPSLTELVSEFYEPEFGAKQNGDAYSAIHHTKKVITEWN